MKPADAHPATAFMAPMGRLAERLFGAWVRQVTPATLRADMLANSLAVALGLHRFRRPWPLPADRAGHSHGTGLVVAGRSAGWACARKAGVTG